MERLCIHTITTKPWGIQKAAVKFTEAGVKGITVWRNVFEEMKPTVVGELLKGNGLDVVSLCRGGFFPDTSAAKRQQAIDDNKLALEEAAAIGAPMVVLVCGASPDQSLETSRKQIAEGIEAVLPLAEKLNVKLAIEPLHPMYADTRSAVNTMGQANDMAELFKSSHVGIAVDVYHLWWDPNLQQEIKRCGENDNLLAYHICDWKNPTEDMLNDRGLMGEGCINISEITQWVEDAGFSGFEEVEIFSHKYWNMDQDIFLDKIIKSYNQLKNK